MVKKQKGDGVLGSASLLFLGVVICFDQHTRGEQDSWEKTQVKKFLTSGFCFIL